MQRARRAKQHASVPLPRVRTGECRREEFLYELKAGPAGGLRPPSGPAATRRPPGQPASPSRQVIPHAVEHPPVMPPSSEHARLLSRADRGKGFVLWKLRRMTYLL
jgi:hypothetical protein